MCVRPLVYRVFRSDVSQGVPQYFTWVADRWLRKSDLQSASWWGRRGGFRMGQYLYTRSCFHLGFFEPWVGPICGDPVSLVLVIVI